MLGVIYSPSGALLQTQRMGPVQAWGSRDCLSSPRGCVCEWRGCHCTNCSLLPGLAPVLLSLRHVPHLPPVGLGSELILGVSSTGVPGTRPAHSHRSHLPAKLFKRKSPCEAGEKNNPNWALPSPPPNCPSWAEATLASQLQPAEQDKNATSSPSQSWLQRGQSHPQNVGSPAWPDWPVPAAVHAKGHCLFATVSRQERGPGETPP